MITVIAVASRLCRNGQHQDAQRGGHDNTLLRQSIAFSCPDRYRKSCVRISRLFIPGRIFVRPIHAFGTKAVFARQKCSGKDTEYFNTLPEYPKPACYCSS